jgi:HK97 family phage prohead protease
MSSTRDFHATGFVSTVDPIMTRGADGDEESPAGLVLEGYAAVFEQPSERMWHMEETIDRGAFDDVLAADPDVRLLASHQGLAMARTSNGTLELSSDDHGLKFRAVLNPEAQISRDLHALIERGDITQMSFGFRAKWDDRTEDCTEEKCTLDHLAITEVTELFEISAVAFPAYRQTEVEAEERAAVATPRADAGTGDEAARARIELAEISLDLET